MSNKKNNKGQNKEEIKAYFVAHLVDNTTKDFDKKCTRIDYSQGIMVTFLHTIDEQNSIVLSIIPVNRILEIEKIDEESCMS